jgi:hypothetical protein
MHCKKRLVHSTQSTKKEKQHNRQFEINKKIKFIQKQIKSKRGVKGDATLFYLSQKKLEEINKEL